MCKSFLLFLPPLFFFFFGFISNQRDDCLTNDLNKKKKEVNHKRRAKVLPAFLSLFPFSHLFLFVSFFLHHLVGSKGCPSCRSSCVSDDAAETEVSTDAVAVVVVPVLIAVATPVAGFMSVVPPSAAFA